ncbi:hypothetical protein N7488_001573 [Penicillium malachiteum]|nr:hypothetical protein N7488_001573 [Penicillium malachiteum]
MTVTVDGKGVERTHSDSSGSSNKSCPRSLQTVFRVSPPGQRKQEFHSRRAHKKSRAGCLTCKKRKVKCDEGKPECQRCNTRGIQCNYSSELVVSRREEVTPEWISDSPPTSLFASLSLDDITKSIETTLSNDRGLNPYSLTSKNSDTPISTVAFHHFVNCSTGTIAAPAIRNVMKTDMIRVAFSVRLPKIMQSIIPLNPPQ